MPLSSYYKKYRDEDMLNRADAPLPSYEENPQMDIMAGAAPTPAPDMDMPEPAEPAAPAEPAPQTDQQKLRSYLATMYPDQLQKSIAGMKGGRASQEDYDRQADRASQNNLLAGLFESAAQVGNIGGQSSKSTIGNFANTLNQQGQSSLDNQNKLYDQNEKDLQTAVAGIGDVQKMDIAQAKADLEKRKSDPNSAESRTLREYAKQRFGGEIPETMSAAFLERQFPVMKDILNKKLERDARVAEAAERTKATAEERRAQREFLASEKAADRDLRRSLSDDKIALAQEKAEKANGANKPLSGEDAKRYDNIIMGSKAVEAMDKALKSGVSTFSLMGDNDFTRARRNFTEAIGRMQSGGAISKDEEARFADMAPKMTDSHEQRIKKLADLRDELQTRLQTMTPRLSPELKQEAASMMPNAGGVPQQAQRRVWKPNQVGAR